MLACQFETAASDLQATAAALRNLAAFCTV
jgi:hypothetical protein